MDGNRVLVPKRELTGDLLCECAEASPIRIGKIPYGVVDAGTYSVICSTYLPVGSPARHGICMDLCFTSTAAHCQCACALVRTFPELALRSLPPFLFFLIDTLYHYLGWLFLVPSS